jgi:uracil-DNA glycosylase
LTTDEPAFGFNLIPPEPTLTTSFLSVGSPSAPIWLVFPAVDNKARAKGSPWESNYAFILKLIWEQAGLRTNDLYVTVVDPTPKDTFHQLRDGRLSTGTLTKFHEEVLQYQPKLLVAVGETLLNEFTGEKGLDNWRGSFLPYKVGTSPRPPHLRRLPPLHQSGTQVRHTD